MSTKSSSLSFFWGNTLLQIHRGDYWYIQTILTQSIIINNVDIMFRKWRHRDMKTSERTWRESCGWQEAEQVMWSRTEVFLSVAFVILVKDLLFLLVCKKVPFPFFMSFGACDNDMNRVFCVKMSLSFLYFRSDARPQREQKDDGTESGLGVVERLNPSCTDCWPHATSEPAGIWTVIWFLILAAFNTFLQMATTEGKIELLLPGRSNMHVCLISHRREKDDAVQIVMSLNFMKSPSLVRSEVTLHRDRTFTCFFFIRLNQTWLSDLNTTSVLRADKFTFWERRHCFQFRIRIFWSALLKGCRSRFNTREANRFCASCILASFSPVFWF